MEIRIGLEMHLFLKCLRTIHEDYKTLNVLYQYVSR